MSAITQEILQDISNINARTSRLNILRQQYMDTGIHICAERAHLATESWKETEGEHIYIRRARVFARICDEIPIVIREHELIVGSQTPFPRGTCPQLDFNPKGGFELQAGERRTRGGQISAVVSEEALKTIVEDTGYWKGRSPGEITYKVIREILGPVLTDLEDGLFHREFAVTAFWNRLPDYGKVLNRGLRGIISEIEEKKSSLRFTSLEDVSRWQFLQAAKICCEAVIRYAKRHAALARESAAVERDVQRKTELEAIAKVCDNVPENPARDFWEALQCVRFIHLATNLECGGRNELIGRIDQYLYPYYRSDLDEGKLTRQRAAELLGCFWMKLAEMEALHSSRDSAQGIHGSKVTLGGLGRDGTDASNELTYLILHVAGQMKTAEPSVFLRCRSGTSRELMLKAVWANIQTGAQPAFNNDEQIIPGLVADGASLEDARDCYFYGCVNPVPWGAALVRTFFQMNGAKVLELVMYNGFDPRTKKKIGMETGDPRSFGSIDDWVEAFVKQWEYVYDVALTASHIGWAALIQHYGLPFVSSLMPDCIQKGLDVLSRGARYPQFLGDTYLRVYADTADSLMAIQKLVYQDKKITIEELIKACASNFQGERGEQIRDMLTMAPKFGNDLGEPEKMYRLLNDGVGEIARSRLTRVTKNGAALHITHGKITGALPTGRKAGMPLADGGISPVAGCDRKGPTATLRSVAKSVDWNTTRSAVLNQKIPKSLLKTRDQQERFVDLIETYFQDYGGYHIQWNIEDAQVYRAAKADPLAHRDLIVRVGGYSAYFVELDPVLQDEIIARTEQFV